MTHAEQKAILEAYTKERHELMERKGEDYAGADVLGLFKDVAKAGGRKPENVILDEVHKKVLRLQNLMQGKQPNNESILDSVTDLSNYADLLLCALREKDTKSDKFKQAYTRKTIAGKDDEYTHKTLEAYRVEVKADFIKRGQQH